MMIVKKPGVLTSSFTALHAFQPTPPVPASPTSCRSSHLRKHRQSSRLRQARWYAQVIDDQTPSESDPSHLPWPDPVPPHTTPTPYQILGIKPNEPYSKSTFHSLVKTYHPDRTQHDTLCPFHIRSVPQHVRLERYRLIIAAHTILSNPAKRTAYDRFGMGWAGHPSVDGGMEKKVWKKGEDPMQNATWEDWERWHSRQSGETQSPIFLSNGTFITIVILVATVGAMAEAKRAKTWGNSFLEQRDIIHAETSRELLRARQAASAAGGHSDRIEAFLRHKNSTTTADDSYRRLLPKPEVCSSGEVTAPGKQS